MTYALRKRVKPILFVKDNIQLVGDTLVIEIGYYLPSRANMRCVHWSVQAKKAQEERGLAMISMRAGLSRAVTGLGWSPDFWADKWHVSFKRLAPRALDDDNLVSAFKSVRDGVADALGMKDGIEGKIKWSYDQQKQSAYGIRIELTRLIST